MAKEEYIIYVGFRSKEGKEKKELFFPNIPIKTYEEASKIIQLFKTIFTLYKEQ
jgi:hypothetical protein